MDLDEMEGTHWWRVCVAAGWISHPCLFSFAISTDAKRIEAVSALSWNVAEHHVFLCSRAFRLFAVADEAAATGSEEAEWGGGCGGGVGAGVMDIFVWCERAEMKKKKQSGSIFFQLLSASNLHFVAFFWSAESVCEIARVNPEKCAHWPICAFANKQPGLLLGFFTAIIYDVVVTAHI